MSQMTEGAAVAAAAPLVAGLYLGVFPGLPVDHAAGVGAGVRSGLQAEASAGVRLPTASLEASAGALPAATSPCGWMEMLTVTKTVAWCDMVPMFT